MKNYIVRFGGLIASDILPETEVTLEEIAAWKGVSVEQVKIKKNG